MLTMPFVYAFLMAAFISGNLRCLRLSRCSPAGSLGSFWGKLPGEDKWICAVIGISAGAETWRSDNRKEQSTKINDHNF